MEYHDSRRLTGVNLQSDLPGTALEADLEPEIAEAAIAAWREKARSILGAIGWADQTTFVRTYEGGATVGFTAPIDALYAACEVNEWAFESAVAEVAEALSGNRIAVGEKHTGDEKHPADAEEVGDSSLLPLSRAAERFCVFIDEERNPGLLELEAAAAEHGVAFLWDDEQVSVGLGSGSRCWPVDAIPAPDDVDWTAIHDVPVVLVTGTNGKTTTVRMLAAIGAAAGEVVGNTSTDGVQIGGDTVLAGDYTGPEGARALLRDGRVGMAVLETARGGMLRRGVSVPRADAAMVTNVAVDHLGEYGVDDVEALADTKLLVTRVVQVGDRDGVDGKVVLNADDTSLVARASGVEVPIVWISTSTAGGRATANARDSVIANHVAAGSDAWFIRDDQVVRILGGSEEEPFLAVGEIPLALGGAARHNLYNALGAAALAQAVGLPDEAIRKGLRGFGDNAEQNPGRGNLFVFGGASVYADFAHNPHGLRAVFEMASELPADRLLVLLGQAGDRDDEAIRELCRVTCDSRPDRIVVKEMREVLRGREEGEVPELIESELLRLGVPAETIERAESEIDAVERALRWARPGDLLLLLLHAQRTDALSLLQSMRHEGWTPGTELTFPETVGLKRRAGSHRDSSAAPRTEAE